MPTTSTHTGQQQQQQLVFPFLLDVLGTSPVKTAYAESLALYDRGTPLATLMTSDIIPIMLNYGVLASLLNNRHRDGSGSLSFSASNDSSVFPVLKTRVHQRNSKGDVVKEKEVVVVHSASFFFFFFYLPRLE